MEMVNAASRERSGAAVATASATDQRWRQDKVRAPASFAGAAVRRDLSTFSTSVPPAMRWLTTACERREVLQGPCWEAGVGDAAAVSHGRNVAVDAGATRMKRAILIFGGARPALATADPVSSG